jgi:signal transduction histidine kinase
MNLLSNAIDALPTRPSPRLITIRTEVKDEGAIIHPNHVVIRIADNGPGMPEDVKKHIFDPFFIPSCGLR